MLTTALALPEEAATLAVPTATPEAIPEFPTLSTLGAELTQLTELDRSFVLLSVKLPIALSCTASPTGTAVLAAEMLIATSAAAETASLAVPAIVEEDAETTAFPTPLVVTAPVLVTAMTPGEELVQVADDVRSFVLPSV